MRKVCIDTNILVWAIKETATVGQEENIPKAQFLFEYFDKKKITVVVPSLVVGELLGNVNDEEERERIFDYISENFEIAQHDLLSALEFAKMRIDMDARNAKEYLKEQNIPKCRMINDYNICSVAKSSGCDAIFSHNAKDFEKFLDQSIPVYTVNYSDTLRIELEEEMRKNSNILPSSQQGNLFESQKGMEE